MKISPQLIDQMIADGMDPMQALLAIRAMVSIKSPEAIRQARKRERDGVTNRDSNAQTVTERDCLQDPPSPLPPLDKSLSPTPPIEINPPLTPQPRKRAFEEFWSAYPNKVGKPKAETAFSKAMTRTDQQTLMAGLGRYVAKTDDRPWCNPATWLNQERWADEPAEVARGSPRGVEAMALDFMKELENDGRRETQEGYAAHDVRGLPAPSR